LEVLLKAGDVTDQPLSKRSMVKVGKLFTMHRRLIASRFGTVEQGKLREVLDRLRALFADRTEHPEDAGEASRTQEVDEAVLALLHLNAFDDRGQTRAWKTFDWDALDRLYEKGLIGDPKSKAKSAPLTGGGRRTAEEPFRHRSA